MNLARRLTKLERIQVGQASQSLVVFYKDPETGILEPTDAIIDENAQVVIVEYVQPVATDE